jgi:hypothetical protein
VQDLEALVLHVLSAVPLHVVTHERVVALERVHRVLQVVLLDLALRVLQKLRDRLYARLRLQILRLDQLLKVLLKFGDVRV